MEKINDNFCGYLKVGSDVYAYNVAAHVVTLLPAESDKQKRYDSLKRLSTSNTDIPEYLFGESASTKIAILRNGKFKSSSIGMDESIRFATPIIIKAEGNAHGFYSMLTAPWEKFHSITFYGGNINALYALNSAVEPLDIDEYLKSNGARKIKFRPWSYYTKSVEFEFEGEKVTLTFSIGQTAEESKENSGSYNLGKLDAFLRFSFENVQGFEMIEKCYILARKVVAILNVQNNVHFEKIYISQRNVKQEYFRTGTCKIFDHYENYATNKWPNAIQIDSVFDCMPNLITGIVEGKAESLLELLPEDNRMVNRISIKNVQDLCTALEVFYHLDDEREREKDTLIIELKKNIKKTIKEFTKIHGEIDVNKETTISSAFQYLDYTLKEKILTLYNENKDVVDAIVSKHLLPQVNELSIASFVKLRNGKTHDGTFEWGDSAMIYQPLFALAYVCFFKYIKMADKVIEMELLQKF